MSLIFRLPDDLIRCLLSEWFGLLEAYKLDCALLTNVFSDDLISMMQVVVWDRMLNHIEWSNEFRFDWAVKRNIRFSALHVSSNSNWINLIDKRSIEVLSFTKKVKVDVRVINACPKLRELRLSSRDVRLSL